MSIMQTESYPTIDGEMVTIRPIRITDAAMEEDFIRRLSPQTKHYRFLGGVRELSPAQVSKLCDVDGRHSMAFVATVCRDGREMEIGVTVADDWQHKGLGTKLMNQLIQSARCAGVKQLYSIDLSDNAAMRALADDLNMSAHRDPDDPHQTIYSLQL